MVTKQQQLEWLVSKIVKWPADGAKIPVSIDDAGNPKFYMPWDAFAPWDVMRVDFTHEEWRQERDKMQKKAEQVAQPAQPAQDSSWHERGELPPVGCECQFFSDGYDAEWFDWCIFHGKATCGGLIIEHHHRTSPSRVTVELFDPLSTNFRPLRTEREKAIDELIVLVGDIEKYPTRRDAIVGIIDAGYRKK